MQFHHIADGLPGSKDHIHAVMPLSAAVADIGGVIFAGNTAPLQYACLYMIRKIFKGKKGGQIGIGLLVGVMDIATANNTVAIVIANPIAKQMSEDYEISAERTACLLDTFSCIMQGIIPYGAQILVAIAAVTGMGYSISAFEIIPNLFYPYLLLVCSLVAILMPQKKK